MKITEHLELIKFVLHSRHFNIQNKLFCAKQEIKGDYVIYKLMKTYDLGGLIYRCDPLPFTILNANMFTTLELEEDISKEDTCGVICREKSILKVKKENSEQIKLVNRSSLTATIPSDIIFYRSPLEIGIFRARRLWESSRHDKTKTNYLKNDDIYTLQILNDVNRSKEHLVPQLIWKETDYNDANIDSYNIAYTSRCINELRSSIPFGNVDSDKLNFSIVGNKFKFHNELKEPTEPTELKKKVKREVTKCMENLKYIDTTIERKEEEEDVDIKLSAHLPTNIIYSKRMKKHLFCPLKCKWEPPNKTKGVIARGVLLVMTVHYAWPYITGRISRIVKYAEYWLNVVVPSIVTWDAMYEPNVHEMTRCPENIFVITRRVYGILSAQMYLPPT